MKFIGFYEYRSEDTGKAIERHKAVTAERQKFPEKYAKIIFGPYSMQSKTVLGGEVEGFCVYETDSPEQLVNVSIAYSPVIRFRMVPIIEASKAEELWEKMKK